MSLELEYRNTFIDIKEEAEEVETSSKVRGHSSPPGRTRRVSFTMETEQEEDAMRTYVSNLAKSALFFRKDLDTSAAPSENSVEPASVLPSFLPAVPSAGSLGHPEACRRPCIYFISGHCSSSDDCAYCHLPHTEKMPKLDKKLGSCSRV